jgi:hypothetical protein
MAMAAALVDLLPLELQVWVTKRAATEGTTPDQMVLTLLTGAAALIDYADRDRGLPPVAPPIAIVAAQAVRRVTAEQETWERAVARIVRHSDKPMRVADVLSAAYREGVPLTRAKTTTILRWLAQRDVIRRIAPGTYRAISKED